MISPIILISMHYSDLSNEGISVRTILKTNERIIQAGVRQHRRGMARGSVGDQSLLGLERINAYFIFGIHADEFVGTELQEPCRRLPGELKDDQHSSLSKNVDLATSILSVARSHCKKGLNRVICKRRNLGINATSCKLLSKASQSVNEH